MAPKAASYCDCQECLATGDADANGVRIGKLWAVAAKTAHLKRVQMQQEPAAIAEAKAHLASLKRPAMVTRDALMEAVIDDVQRLDIGTGSPSSGGTESRRNTIPAGYKSGDKRGDKQERSKLTVKAHLILTNVETRVDTCTAKLQQGPPLEAFQYVERELPQLAEILSQVTRNVKSVVARKILITQKLKTLEARFSGLQRQGVYGAPSTNNDQSALQFNTDHHFDQPINTHHPFSQIVLFIAVTAAVLMGVSRRMGDLLLNLLSLMLHHVLNDSFPTLKAYISGQIPDTLETALKKFNLEPKIITYAVCPSCHCTYPPSPSISEGSKASLYPMECNNRPNPDSDICRASLLEFDEDGLNPKPRKTFHYRPFHDYVASLLSQPDLEAYMDQSTDDLMTQVKNGGSVPPYMTDIFDAEFVRKFEGPTAGRLFLDRPGTEGRYLFAFNLDFFSAEGQTIRGPTASCGIISAVCLNLPLHLRYKPENMYIAGIIPGPAEPHKTEINHYMRIVIDDLIISWVRGVRYTRTAKYTKGRTARCAMALSVNDLPAARMFSQWAHFKSHHFCSRCHCFHLQNLGRCDTTSRDWRPKDKNALRRMAEAWRDAATVAEQEALFKKNGIRWSELWRLPYWDQPTMLVVDSMHCLLEGLAQFHFREVLQLKDAAARAREDLGSAFELTQVSPDEAYVNERKLSVNDLKHIPHVYAYLVAPIHDADDPIHDEADDAASPIDDDNDAPNPTSSDLLSKRLLLKNLKALQFVSDALGLVVSGKKTKKNVTQVLVEWRMKQPLTATDVPVRLNTMAIMDHIRSVIRDMDVPSWIPSVPYNFGKAAAGTLKADEWRTMATIYLPVALISAWGEGSAHPSANASIKFRTALDHTMSLVSAILVACRRTLTKTRMESYRSNIKSWLEQLQVLYPETKPRVNGHMALHIYDYMKLFGPIRLWWCFPFERLIGQLQRLPSNHKFGQLEGTMLLYSSRITQLKRWLSRPGCPPVIQDSKDLFDAAFAAVNVTKDSDIGFSTLTTVPRELQPYVKESRVALPARYRFDDVTFARMSTHVGNSLILYFPAGDLSSDPIPASIIHIVGRKNKVVEYFVREQLPAAPGTIDPFQPYPELCAKVYSTNLSSELRLVKPDWVFSHFARWNLDKERTVVVNLSRD